MPHAVMLMALATHLKTRERMVEALTVLRRKVHEEQARDVRRRSLRVRHYATLDCIPDPRDSDWMKLWRNGSDENFIHYTSLDRISFCRLLEQFSPYYKLPGYNHKGGRPPRLQHKHQALAVVLTFYVDSHHEKHASVYFGAPPSTLSRVLNSAEEALGKALASFRPARISWPSGARQRALAKLTALREPLLQFTWGFIDGKNLNVSTASTSFA
ncbi:hypothetical protein ON010_g6535 [Phytophthora cinnamomi]|nr:hypothetical protein ON010_g6535 [Phytophthora cinnamomi]